MASSLHHAHAALSVGSLTLHLLADLDVDIEELGDTAVEADGLALVEICLAVRGVDAFGGAGFEETASHIHVSLLDLFWIEILGGCGEGRGRGDWVGGR